MTTFGLLIFEEAEELDFCGPWEVFTASSMLRDFPDQVLLIAEQPGPVRCGKGMRVLPDRTLEDAPQLDLLLVPGGYGTRREVSNTKLISWIAQASATATWVTGVCTGALLLHEAGVARGPRRRDRRARRPVCRRREPGHQPGRLRRNRYGPVG